MEVLEKDIEIITRNKEILEKLRNSGIILVKDLCNKTRKDLEDLQIPNMYIKEIIISLQINGVDLKKRTKKVK